MRTYYKKETKTHTMIFESVSESVLYMKDEDLEAYNEAYGSWTGRPEVTHIPLDEFKSKVNAYWQEGHDKVRKMLDSVESAMNIEPPKSRKKKKKWNSESGGYLDLDRLRSGQDYWLDLPKVKTRAPKIIKVVINLSGLSVVTPDEMMFRAVAALVFTKLVEQVGYRVELWGVRYATRAKTIGKMLQVVRLKGSSDPLNMGSLINAVSAWFLRIVLFSTHEQYVRTEVGKKIGLHIGGTIDFTDTQLKEFLPDPENAIKFQDAYNLDDSLRLIKRSVARLDGLGVGNN